MSGNTYPHLRYDFSGSAYPRSGSERTQKSSVRLGSDGASERGRLPKGSRPERFSRLLRAGLHFNRTGLQLLEEVVALVVDEDEGRESRLRSCRPLPCRVRRFHAFDALDAVAREHRGHAADRAEVEAPCFLQASVTTSVRLPLAIITIEPPCDWKRSTYGPCGWRSSGPSSRKHSLRGLGGTGVENRMVLDVVGELFAAVKAFLELGVRDVASDDDRAVSETRVETGYFVRSASTSSSDG